MYMYKYNQDKTGIVPFSLAIQDCYRTIEGDIIITSDCQQSRISCLSKVLIWYNRLSEGQQKL